jgi:hypothetical protein
MTPAGCASASRRSYVTGSRPATAPTGRPTARRSSSAAPRPRYFLHCDIWTIHPDGTALRRSRNPARRQRSTRRRSPPTARRSPSGGAWPAIRGRRRRRKRPALRCSRAGPFGHRRASRCATLLLKNGLSGSSRLVPADRRPPSTGFRLRVCRRSCCGQARHACCGRRLSRKPVRKPVRQSVVGQQCSKGWRPVALVGRGHQSGPISACLSHRCGGNLFGGICATASTRNRRLPTRDRLSRGLLLRKGSGAIGATGSMLRDSRLACDASTATAGSLWGFATATAQTATPALLLVVQAEVPFTVGSGRARARGERERSWHSLSARTPIRHRPRTGSRTASRRPQRLTAATFSPTWSAPASRWSRSP